MNLNTIDVLSVVFSAILLATYVNWPIRENSENSKGEIQENM